MIGQRVAHYEITAKLGAGGMGEVYLATDTRLNRQVALKFLLESCSEDPEFRARFEHEARASAGLDHPNIVTTYELREHEGRLLIAMQYIEGRTLQQMIDSGALTVDLSLDIARQVCQGLAKAHDAGIVHRDIKPANIMLTPEGVAKILDFGLVKSGRLTGHTKVGVPVGTAGYMSPEQVRGDPVDGRTDLWALGVSLFQSLTGRLPFAGDYDLAMLYAILHEEAPAARDLVADLPPWVDPVLFRALQKDREARFSSAGEFLAALKEQEESARPVSRSAAPEPTDRSIAVIDFDNLTGTAEDDWISSGLAETITVDLQKLPGLTVTARHTVARTIKDESRSGPGERSPEKVLTLGTRLSVRWIVWGTFQRLGDRIRITAHFTDVRHGESAGSIKIDGVLTDLFRLQDEIVASLAETIKIEISGSDLAKIQQAETVDQDAFELFARGRQAFLKFEQGAYGRAEEYFRKAIARDPRYALAYSGLGELHLVRYISATDPHDLDEGIRILKQAVALDPDLPEPHVWLTYAYARNRMMDESTRSGLRALQLDPDHPLGHYFLAVTYNMQASAARDFGLFEQAILHNKKCIALSPKYQPAYMNLGAIYCRLGQYQHARPYLERAMEIELSGKFELVQSIGGLTLLGNLVCRIGDWELAEEYYRRSLERLQESDHTYRNLFLAHTHWGLGNIALARRSFDTALACYNSARQVAREFPRALGIGYFYLRADIGRAHAYQRLAMHREATASIAAAERLLGEKAEFDFTSAWEGADYHVRFDLACYYASKGEAARSLDLLQQASREGFTEWPRLKSDECFDAIRGEAQFTEILEGMKPPAELP